MKNKLRKIMAAVLAVTMIVGMGTGPTVDVHASVLTYEWSDLSNGHSFGALKDITVDNNGIPYVAETGSNDISYLNGSTWTTIPAYPGKNTIKGVAKYGTNLYIVDSGLGQVLKYDGSTWTNLTNNLIIDWMDVPDLITVDPSENLYVADSAHGIVCELPAGTSVWSQLAAGDDISGATIGDMNFYGDLYIWDSAHQTLYDWFDNSGFCWNFQWIDIPTPANACQYAYAGNYYMVDTSGNIMSLEYDSGTSSNSWVVLDTVPASCTGTVTGLVVKHDQYTDALTIYVTTDTGCVYKRAITIDTPTIENQPADQTILEGNYTEVEVYAYVSDDGNLSYQWQNSTDHGTTWNDLTGETGPACYTEDLFTADSGIQYRCIITNTNYGVTKSTTSAAATITVDPVTLTADKTEISQGESVNFTTNEDPDNMAAFFLDGEYWNYGSIGTTPNPFAWTLIGTGHTKDVVATYRVYDLDANDNPPDWNTPYLKQVQVIFKVDPETLRSGPAVTADDKNNVIVGADATMEYSADAGTTWTAYNPSNIPTFPGKQTVLVRLVANETYAAGKVTTLTFTENQGDKTVETVVSGEGTPKVTSDGLAALYSTADAEIINNGGTVNIALNVAKNEASANTSDVTNAATNDLMEIGIILDIDILKTIVDASNASSAEAIKDTGSNLITLTVPLPDSLKGKASYAIYRYHEGSVNKLTSVPNANGEYVTVNDAKDTLKIVVSKFSTYAIGYSDVNITTSSARSFYPLCLKATASKTSQKLTFKAVTGADGYYVYSAKCGGTSKRIADITATTYTVSKLQADTFYKFKVKAYKVVNGKKVIFARSQQVHAITTSSTYANPTIVTADVSKVSLKVKKTKQLACSTIIPNGMKMDLHTTEIRYESSDKSIAKISSNGKITAVAKGTCTVYAYAQNGVCKKITVTVK